VVSGDRRGTRKRKRTGLGCHLGRRGFGPSGKRRRRVASLARKIAGEGKKRVLASTKRDAGTQSRARVGVGLNPNPFTEKHNVMAVNADIRRKHKK